VVTTHLCFHHYIEAHSLLNHAMQLWEINKFEQKKATRIFLFRSNVQGWFNFCT